MGIDIPSAIVGMIAVFIGTILDRRAQLQIGLEPEVHESRTILRYTRATHYYAWYFIFVCAACTLTIPVAMFIHGTEGLAPVMAIALVVTALASYYYWREIRGGFIEFDDEGLTRHHFFGETQMTWDDIERVGYGLSSLKLIGDNKSIRISQYYGGYLALVKQLREQLRPEVVQPIRRTLELMEEGKA